MIKQLFTYFVELTGNPFASHILKTITQSPFSRLLIRPYAFIFKINLVENERPLKAYRSLHDFFTRRLQAGSRPISTNDSTLISPVDGVLSEQGKIDAMQQFMIKGQNYSIQTILGTRDIKTYENGHFYVFYLSPKHYHHFHYPINGQLLRRYALGDVSYPVNQLGLKWGKQPFATNHRIISEINSSFGQMAIITIGALNINSIQLSHAKGNFSKGEEFGSFSFGSSVILLLENHPQFASIPTNPTEIQMGQSIGEWKT